MMVSEAKTYPLPSVNWRLQRQTEHSHTRSCKRLTDVTQANTLRIQGGITAASHSGAAAASNSRQRSRGRRQPMEESRSHASGSGSKA